MWLGHSTYFVQLGGVRLLVDSVLSFSEAEPRKPVFEKDTMISFGRESEFLAANGSGHDAHEVFLEPITIGRFTFRGRIPISIRKGESARLEYGVSYEEDGSTYGTFEHRHNLRPLLDALFKESGYEDSGKMLTIALQLSYKDSSGNRFAANFLISHHPHIPECPLIHIKGVARLPRETRSIGHA